MSESCTKTPASNQMEFLGPHTEYDEEEEEKKYYRRMRLGVVKNVVAASLGGMITYSVYLGMHSSSVSSCSINSICRLLGKKQVFVCD